MTKTLKKSLLITFISLLGAVAALFAVSLLPSANSASADESTETTYTLDFYDSDGTTVLKTFTGSGDKVFTEEEYNSIPAPTVPDGKVFTGYWSTYINGYPYELSCMINKKYSEIAPYFNGIDSVYFFPVSYESPASIKFYDISKNVLIGTLTKASNEPITKADLDAILAKPEYYSYDFEGQNPIGRTIFECINLDCFDYFYVSYHHFYKLTLMDSVETEILRRIESSNDNDIVITKDDLNTLPVSPIEGKVFTGYWDYYIETTGFSGTNIINITNKTLEEVWAELNITEMSEIVFTPFYYNAVASIQFNAAEDMSVVLGTLTKASNEPITKADLDSVLAKRGYSYVYSLSVGGKDSVLANPADIEGKTPFELMRETADNYFVVYQINNYTTTIKFGNDVVKTYTNQYNSRISAGLLKTDLAKAGYRIIGLSETADGTAITTIPEEGLHVVNDATYYVRYQKIQTLSIIDGDKTETAEVPADTPLFIKNYVSADKFKREGYIFKGFALTEGGEVAYDLDTTQITITADTTLYAVYVKALTVSFMADGKVAFYAMIEPGKTIDLSGSGIHSILEKPGYTLKGFATEENGEIVYAATDIIIPETDMTLYAVYEEVKTPGGDENPDNPGDIGDKVNDVSNKISEWIKGKTGIALSSSAVIVLAVVFAIVLFKRK